jgi:hypothetical protein
MLNHRSPALRASGGGIFVITAADIFHAASTRAARLWRDEADQFRPLRKSATAWRQLHFRFSKSF